ncbi:MAG: class I SAM-dependent methyltransferase [Acholeplasmataceae bacterium]|jgi:predicted O-methyltransferase YrrM|nr:class I SAM-dependent methyltransferase [Acholeplasmataceae bacterium]
MLDVLKKYAIDHNIPILGDEGLLLIKNLIEKHHIKDVLEIGTAMGYSALAMSSFGCFVDTMERDLIMIDLAKENFARYDTNQNIRLIETNALTFDGELKSYDLIFIDAAKAQYIKFFEKYAPYLKKDGFIVCDNLNFHHLDIKKVNRNTRQLLNKIHQFKSFLMNNNDFITTFTDVGDGMSISKRK